MDSFTCTNTFLSLILCPSSLLVFPSTSPLYLPAYLSKSISLDSPVPPIGSITQPPLNQFHHTHSLPDCCCVVLYRTALFSGQICICPLPVCLRPALTPSPKTNEKMKGTPACCSFHVLLMNFGKCLVPGL